MRKKKKKEKEKGFSLVEILAAIVILGILMTLAANAYNVYKKKARQQAYDTMAKNATHATTNYLMDNAKTKYVTFETLKENEYLDTLQDPKYKDKNCSGIVINKVIQGDENRKIDVLFQKVKLCCEDYKYQYDYTGDKVKVTEINSCNYVTGDEIDGVYKLIFKPSGGTACDPEIIMKKQKEKWGPLCVTTRENFVFKRWNTKKNGSGRNITADDEVGDKDISAYAIWNEIFQLKYNEDGGTECNPKSIKKENGEKWGDLCVTTRTGYAFKGWRTKENGDGTKITKNSIAEKNLNVYAHWNPYITITFDPQGGTECTIKSITKEKGEEWGTLCAPTKSGYVFKGWNTKADGTGNFVTSTTKASTNMTLYAVWNPIYTLTYDEKNGKKCDPSSKSVENGKPWGPLCETEKYGYSFGGWYNGATKVTKDSEVTGNIKVEAKWNPRKCVLTYDEKGGSGRCTSKETNFAAKWGSLCVPSRTGYTFNGWLRNGTLFTENNTCDNLNTEIYATWTINTYILGYDDNGGSGCAGTTKSRTYNSKWETLCEPTREGHTFAGWYDGNSSVDANTKATKNVTVKASWTANKYKLTYKDNGGSGCEGTTKSKTYNTNWESLCTPSRTGHEFVGWNTNANGTGTNVTINDKVPAYNQTVYAQWSANTCTLKYNDNGGSGCAGTESKKTYGSNNTWNNLCTTSTKEHYNFAGWNTKADGTGTTVNSSTPTTSICDSTLYAQWTKKSYTLSFKNNVCASITKLYNENWGTLCNQSAEGYTFNGWYYGTEKITSTTKATRNMTVEPSWTVNTYTLHYDSAGGTSCDSQKGTYGYGWGELCEPTKTGYNFDGWYSGNTRIYSSSVVKNDLYVTARWSESSRLTSVKASKTGNSSTVTVTMTASSPDASKGIVSAKATNNGKATCSLNGTTINCTVTGVSGKTVSNDNDCQKLAVINNVNIGIVSYLTNEYYNYSKWASYATAGCYQKVSNAQGSTGTWTCMLDKAKNSFLVGSESHCRIQECGYSDCLTRGYVDLGGGLKTCQCWIKVNSSNHTQIYDTEVTVEYYTFN